MEGTNIDQSIEGSQNTLAGRDLHQYHIQIGTTLSDPSFPQDIDQALKRTIASLEVAQRSKTKAEERIAWWALLITAASLFSCASVFRNNWVLATAGFLVVGACSWKISKPLKDRSFIKIDIKAHQDVLGELCKRKVLSRI